MTDQMEARGRELLRRSICADERCQAERCVEVRAYLAEGERERVEGQAGPRATNQETVERVPELTGGQSALSAEGEARRLLREMDEMLEVVIQQVGRRDSEEELIQWQERCRAFLSHSAKEERTP